MFSQKVDSTRGITFNLEYHEQMFPAGGLEWFKHEGVLKGVCAHVRGLVRS